DDAATQTYELLSRRSLGERIKAAKNWLEIDYPKVVKKMESLFGEGKVQEFFNPLGATRPGTKTVQANASLQQAEEELKALIATEEGQFNSLAGDQREQMLIKASGNRLAILEYVGKVYLGEEYQRPPDIDNIKTLNFEDD